MTIPKTSVLLQSENAGREEQTRAAAVKSAAPPAASDKPILQIRPVECTNDFVAVLQSELETFLALSDSEERYRNEGLVVGVGPGVADGAGGRLKPCVNVGDYVMFGAKNIVATIHANSGSYADKKVVILSERNILCKLPNKIQFEICGV
jgi:co-chaperonin GroES (HSP10)